MKAEPECRLPAMSKRTGMSATTERGTRCQTPLKKDLCLYLQMLFTACGVLFTAQAQGLRLWKSRPCRHKHFSVRDEGQAVGALGNASSEPDPEA